MLLTCCIRACAEAETVLVPPGLLLQQLLLLCLPLLCLLLSLGRGRPCGPTKELYFELFVLCLLVVVLLCAPVLFPGPGLC